MGKQHDSSVISRHSFRFLPGLAWEKKGAVFEDAGEPPAIRQGGGGKREVGGTPALGMLTRR